MLSEFIDFVDSILPSVSMEKKEGIKEAIAQFKKEGHEIKYLMLNPLSELSQGDVISSVPFYYFDEDGKQMVFRSDALVLSTSCHIDQKNKLVLVPVFPLNSFKGNLVELKKNTIIDYMYIPDGNLSDKYVDFEIMNTFSKDLIMNGLKNRKLTRVASLNQIGYYFFVVKLTVYLMRREDAGTQKERSAGAVC